MANQSWVDEVRWRLVKQALPPAYIRRFTEELSDHFQDITEDTMSTEADVLSRLGEPKQVAEAAAVAYRRRSFLGRHPTAAFLVFAVSPVVSLIVLFVLAIVTLNVVELFTERLGFVSAKRFTDKPGVISLTAMRYAIGLVTVVLPAILAGIVFCKLAKRLGIGRKWAFVSCAVLGLTAMLLRITVATKLVDGYYAVSVGIAIPGWYGSHFHPTVLQQIRQVAPVTILQLLQLVVPLAVCWWFMRCRRDCGQVPLAS